MSERADGGVLQLLAVCLAAAGWLSALTATLMTSWLTLSTELLPTETYHLGLWETCVVQDLGLLECRPYDGLLGLPPDIKLARALMCGCVGGGLLALLLAVPGLGLVNGCRGHAGRKRALRAAGGGLLLAAGGLGLVPASYVAHLTVLRFFDPSLPDLVPRWEFGDALFCGWTGGVLQLASGALLLASCTRRCDGHAHQTPVATTTRSHGSRTEYV